MWMGMGAPELITAPGPDPNGLAKIKVFKIDTQKMVWVDGRSPPNWQSSSLTLEKRERIKAGLNPIEIKIIDHRVWCQYRCRGH